MGVPALFRTLERYYPKIIEKINEEKPQFIDGKIIPVDATQPNLNGETDNLYLDMNGIVHPCTHPENKPAPPNEEAMMLEIFLYLDRIFSILRPRKLVYMAIAPRAKMNQQRSRRFRAAKEAEEKHKKELKNQVIDENNSSEREKNKFDSNCITPGTPFMKLLSDSLKYYITEKINTDPSWKNLNVILSDATVPGEGEHKIMDFIRRMRASDNYDPNLRHDADLIMLTLATHEPNFRIFREDVFSPEANTVMCYNCGQTGHAGQHCKNEPLNKNGEPVDIPKTPFLFLNISILREYLEHVLFFTSTDIINFELERAIDDWVFMMIMVGNDFLPHMPTLKIRERAINILVSIWKETVLQKNSYLTQNGEVLLLN